MPARSQQFLVKAEELVTEVDRRFVGSENPGRKVYGGLCHSFPVMVRTCGLCQALAFSEAKAGLRRPDNEREQAHGLLLDHVAEILRQMGVIGVGQDAMAVARGQDTLTYMLATRQVLDAWIYFKRFAVSILKVEDARAARDETPGGAGG